MQPWGKKPAGSKRKRRARSRQGEKEAYAGKRQNGRERQKEKDALRKNASVHEKRGIFLTKDGQRKGSSEEQPRRVQISGTKRKEVAKKKKLSKTEPASLKERIPPEIRKAGGREKRVRLPNGKTAGPDRRGPGSEGRHEKKNSAKGVR